MEIYELSELCTQKIMDGQKGAEYLSVVSLLKLHLKPLQGV